MKITIIVDNPNSWMIKYAEEFVKELNEKYQCNLINNHEEIQKGDIAFFLSCEKFITKETREKNKYNIVIHASDLPKGKGWSPMTWQVLKNKNKIPLTLFEVADKIDAGCYYLKDNFELNGSELIEELREKMIEKMFEMIKKFIEKNGELKCIEQEGESTIYKKRTPKDSELDINKTIKEQFNLLRIVDNERYPAFFEINGNKYILKIYKENK